MGRQITRCHSSGDLYPVIQESLPSTCLASSLTAVSSDMWHHRPGHPGNATFSYLRSNKLISCNKEHDSTSCNFCPLGKHIRLPFYSSSSTTNCAFDIIHSDLWTSPIRSNNGHKYYLVLLDDYSHYVRTIPLSYKSQVYQTFLDFVEICCNAV